MELLLLSEAGTRAAGGAGSSKAAKDVDAPVDLK